MRSASQARSTPVLLAGRGAVVSVMGVSVRPYIHVSSAYTSRAPADPAARRMLSVSRGNWSRQRVKGGIAQ
jgi:hypothetical protein